MISLMKLLCPLCSGSDDEVYITFSDSPFKIVTCKKCGMMRLNPGVAETELNKMYHPTYCGDINKALDESPSSFFQGLIEWKWKQLMNRIHHHRLTILRMVTCSCNLLEIGCGDGGFLAYLQERGWQVVGTEYTPYAVALGQRRGLKVMEGELQDLKLPSEYYDLIAMYHVLEHVYHPEELLQEICRILKPGGILVVEVPNIASLSARVFGSDWYLLAVPKHVSHFSPSTLSQMLKSSGLVVSRVFHSSPDSFASWKLGLKAVGRNLLGLKRRKPTPSLSDLDETEYKGSRPMPLRTQVIDLLLDPLLAPFLFLEKVLSSGSIFTVVAKGPR